MKEIKLTQGRVALVDDEDFDYLNQWKWYLSKNGNSCYAFTGIKKNNNKTKNTGIHRVIMKTSDKLQVDHINGNGLDNRKNNLRNCTSAENSMNQCFVNKNNRLGIKGVYFDKQTNKFRARIKINRKELCLGRYSVLADADQARRDGEVKYFGKFSRQYTIVPIVE